MYPSGDNQSLESVIMSDQFLQCIQSVDDPTKQQPCQTLPYYGLYMKSCLFLLTFTGCYGLISPSATTNEFTHLLH